MRTRDCLKGALLLVLVIASLILSVSHVARAQFEVSPPGFTKENVPLGYDYCLETRLDIWNKDNIKRLFSIYAVKPPKNLVEEGFEPIPDNSWLFIVDNSIELEANSSKSVEIWANIPRWESLLGKRWEAWIRIERAPEPGEIISQSVDVVARLVTATELPGPPSPLLASLKISEENFALQAGKSKYLTATLTYENNVIKGETITWSATAGTIAPSSGKTNTAGQVSVVYTAPSYETHVIVSASYAGSEQYEASSGTSFGTIAAPPTGVSMELVIAIAILIGCAIIGAAILLARRR